MNKAQTRCDLSRFLPGELAERVVTQQLIPSIAKDPGLSREIEQAARQVPSRHVLYRADARELSCLAPGSVHLVLTSPPYWTLKEYDTEDGQLGAIDDYETFLAELDKVWQTCFDALTPGGRMVCVVGDVCLSRRRNRGVHEVVPLHASIQEHCRRIGFANLSPIIWHKIANAAFEAQGNGGGFLGKPYEPNAVVKNDIEFILMLRKPGGYRTPNAAERLLSLIPDATHKAWFQQVWTGLTGASTRDHPAPFPLELAERLIRMFSFVGDTVLDPFAGTGTTMLAAAKWGRNSVGVEVGSHYARMARQRFEREMQSLLVARELTYVADAAQAASPSGVDEDAARAR
jgi:modification methylase